MLVKAISLLNALGFTVSDNDPMVNYIVGSVSEKIKNETNLGEIPSGLEFMAAEMVVGAYLKLMKDSGKLNEFDTDAAVKSISEGDTNITFAIGEGCSTPEQRLDDLIAYLTEGRQKEFIRYRRLVW